MDNLIVTIACLFIGLGIRHLPDFSNQTGNVLNVFVIYISLPALVLLNIPQLEVSAQLLVPSLMPWGMLVVSALLILALAKKFKWNRGTTGALLLVVPLGNTSFLGIPMTQAFFGDQAIPYAVLYDQLGSYLILATYGSVVIAFYGGGDATPSVKAIAKKVATFPPFIALLLAFALRTIHYPSVVSNLLEILAATLVPLVMIAVGFQLRLRLSKEVVSQMAIGLSVKLLVAPLVALTFCKIIGLEGEVVDVSILEAAMPPMVSAGALAILANMAPKLTAAMVGGGIALSFITVPLIYMIL